MEKRNKIRLIRILGIIVSFLAVVMIVVFEVYIFHLYNVTEDDLYYVSGVIENYINNEEELSLSLSDYDCTFVFYDMDIIDQKILDQEISKGAICQLYVFQSDADKISSKDKIEIHAGYINQKNFLDFNRVKEYNSFDIRDVIILVGFTGFFVFAVYSYIRWNKGEANEDDMSKIKKKPFVSRVEINEIKDTYRGIERKLYIDEYKKKLPKKEFKQLSKEYNKYLNDVEDDSQAEFNRILPFYKHLKEIGCNVEIVWIDINKHDSFYGIPITLLGLDIEYQGFESLIVAAKSNIQYYLNENGLCQTYEDAFNILEIEKNQWDFSLECLDIVYVYKIEI